jgi:hypothetical protein
MGADFREGRADFREGRADFREGSRILAKGRGFPRGLLYCEVASISYCSSRHIPKEAQVQSQ